MLIKSLKLNNIRSYVSEEIKFEEGITLLSGDIGGGKTTILLALEFALFGIMRGELSGSALLRHGSNDGSVELELEVNKSNYVIKRGLKRTSNGVSQSAGYLIKDGTKVDCTAQELKSKILELLNYSKDLLNKSKSLIFRFTVYTPQEAMKNILYETADSRIDTLRKIFDMDKYKRVKENTINILKDYRNEELVLKERIATLQEDLGDEESLLKKIAELKLLLEERKNKLQLTNKNFEDKNKEIILIEKQRFELEELKKKLAVTLRDIKNIQERILEVKQEQKTLGERIKLQEENLKLSDVDEKLLLKEINELKTNDSELKGIDNLFSSKKEQLRIITSDLKNNKEQLIDIQKKQSSLKLKISEQEKNLKSVDINEESLLKELASLKEEESKLETKKSILNKKEAESNAIITQSKNNSEKILKLDNCPTCNQEVNEQHKEKIRVDAKKIIAKEDDRKQKLEKIRLLIKKKQEENLKKREELIQKKSLLEVNKVKLSQLKEQNSELEQLNNAFSDLEKNNSELVKNEDICKKELLTLGKNLSNETFEELDLEKISLIIKEKTSSINAKKEEVNQKKSLLEANKIKYKQLQDFKAQLIRLEKVIEELQDKEKQEVVKKESYEQELKNKSLIDEESLLKLKESLKLIQKEKESLIEKLSENKNSLKYEEEKLLKIKEKKEKQKLSEESLKKTQEKIIWLNKHLLNLTSSIEKTIFLSIYNVFNDYFKTWFNTLMEDESISARLDSEFTPLLTQNGYETYIDNLSGGEKTSLALAYRLALNKVINEFMQDINTKDLLILDEPTDGFSSEQLDRVREVLEQLRLKQIIIVSHEKQVESFADNIVRVIKENHESHVI